MAISDKGYFWQSEDPLWYKDAIIYELHPRAFFDSNEDGIGDFPGLTEKLDYLQDLGVTAIWLLPFYPSPLKDDGYDISSYTNIQPVYGTLRDFRVFLREADLRGLRVITELVLNHTSDQHRWFQRARRAKIRSRWRDFYVWSDTADRYKDARIIFKDFETSNWNWDHIAKAYYWHRFYSHQPDLNFDNPQVRREMMRAVDFWLSMGVSGLRLDAVPYLYERDGTNCENLSETHVFLKELRRQVDEQFRNRMLLAEANQWSEDAVAYFGDGDECQMAFQFPVMPRMFMAIRMEDRFPLIDIMEQTPAIPESCQWALFLRNHDELTLEMVTDEERDYMYRVYAQDTQARINLGIRRRLAPLLNNDRKKMELMNCLLFCLPGTPVIYYGDEIGMGDNFYLGDRNGVRTPMQWSADRNAGFSRANPQRLFLPIVIDPEYHYEAINVEAQQSNPDSLLWWMKRLMALRKRYKALSRGSIEFLYPENRKVLAFVRRFQEQNVLVVANLSRQAQYTSLDLTGFIGRVPVEVLGQAEFPVIDEAPYRITLGPYAFYWFSLESRQPVQVTEYKAPAEVLVPTLSVTGAWKDIFRHEIRLVLESTLLGHIRQRRWFGGKARHAWSAMVQDIIPLHYDSQTAYLTLLNIKYSEGEPETYLLPVAFASGEQAGVIASQSPQAIIAQLELRDRAAVAEGMIYDAMVTDDFRQALLDLITRRRHLQGEVGKITAHPTKVFRKLRGPANEILTSSLLSVEQSNTSALYGNRLMLKLLRRPEEGGSPEMEIGLYLTEKASFPNAPPVAGVIEYQGRRQGEQMTLGVLHGYIRNEGDAWRYTLDSLGRFFEQVLAQPGRQAPLPFGDSPLEISEENIPPLVEETIGTYLESARLLGQRTAELHLALASAMDDPNLNPEPYSVIYQRSLYHSLRGFAIRVLQLLRHNQKLLPKEVRGEAQKVLALEDSIISHYNKITGQKISAMRIRCHGDYHLGQVLYTGNDFVIIDFEGEPGRPLGERRIKRSPLRDVAGMIRSFHYASHVALRGQTSTVLREEDQPVLEEWAQAWYLWVSAAFLKSYLELMADVPVLPKNRDELKITLDAFLIDKALYEVNYELNNRPDWVGVPLKGILQVLGAEEVTAQILLEAREKAKKESKEKLTRIIAEVKQKSEELTKEAEQAIKEARQKARNVKKAKKK